MSRFNDPSFKLGDSREFLMHENLTFDGEVVVPASLEEPFSTDFASIPLVIPKWLLNPLGGGFLDKEGRSRKPAVWHDHGCRTSTSYKERVKADTNFRKTMKSEGVGRFASNVMYGAVRANTERMRLMRKWK